MEATWVCWVWRRLPIKGPRKTPRRSCEASDLLRVRAAEVVVHRQRKGQDMYLRIAHRCGIGPVHTGRERPLFRVMGAMKATQPINVAKGFLAPCCSKGLASHVVRFWFIEAGGNPLPRPPVMTNLTQFLQIPAPLDDFLPSRENSDQPEGVDPWQWKLRQHTRGIHGRIEQADRVHDLAAADLPPSPVSGY